MDVWRESLYYRLMRSQKEESNLRVTALRLNCAPQFYSCSPDWSWSAVPLPDHDFWFVADGRGEIEVNRSKVELSPGVCFIWQPGDAPRATQDLRHRLTVFYCNFDPLDGDGNVTPLLGFPCPMQVRDINFFVASAQRAERLWQRGDEFGKQQATSLLSGLLWQLWDEVHHEVPVEDANLEELIAAVRREPHKAWSLDEMAHRVHLSRAQFTRRFRAAFGTSPARFVIQTRIERARQLLLESDMTLEQIARTLGYADAYFFSRQFKQFAGQSPGALRRR